jgi:flagellar biosynthesis protein FlhF
MTPGTCFKFTVASAEQAAVLIREKLGDRARVLSVRTVQPRGIRGLFVSPKLEVIAQIAGPETENVENATAPEASPLASDGTSSAGIENMAVTPGSGGRPDRHSGSNGQRDDGRYLEPVLSAASASGGAALQPALKTAGLRINAPRRVHAPRLQLAELLRRTGLSEHLLMRLSASPAWLALNELPLHRALVETGRYLCELGAARGEAAPLTRAAFIGANGAGRTTALCKWLATEVFRRARLGHVVTAEFDRPNPAGPLPVFCEALGVPMAHFPASTQPATPGGFVFFDLPGISLRQPADNAALADFLARERIEQRVLVLNAAYENGALRAAYAAGRELGATHVVFTHLDEVAQWGRLWDYLLDGELEPLFLATGPSLTGDCELDVLDAVARRTLPALGATDDSAAEPAAEPDDETLPAFNTAA